MTTKQQKRLKVSAGLLMYRLKSKSLEVFLVHPGGPFFDRRDEGVWGIPKGEIEDNEDLLNAAIREFEEETGIKPRGGFVPLGSVRQKSGKTVHAWAFEEDWEETTPIRSNTFTMEWPPHSGQEQEFPEIDRGAFFEVDTAQKKINPAQVELIERLQNILVIHPAAD